MTTNLIPKSICKEINNLQRDFWSGKQDGKKKFYLKAWSTFQESKENGGLGIREMEVVNKALVIKMGWRFLKNLDDILVKLLKAKYLRKSKFWDIKQPNLISFTWKAIIESRDLSKKGMLWTVASGHNINILEDPRIPSILAYRANENNT